MKYRFFGYLIAILVSVGYLIYRYLFLNNPSDFHKEILVTTAFSFLMTAIVAIYELAKNHGKYFWLAIKCWLLIPNKKVYVSLSYLIRIKIKGLEKYLLVKGTKINQYQPVGGVYKLVGNKDIYKDWKASIKPDAKNPKDLRFFVKAKHLPEILKWFKSGKDREVGVWREFFEELVETKILSSDNFQTIRSEYLYTREKILSKETRFNNENYHTLVYNIFNIELNESQLSELINLEKKKTFTKKYAFVNEDEINKECFNNSSTKIGEHAKHIL
jgi:hypothetical protein